MHDPASAASTLSRRAFLLRAAAVPLGAASAAASLYCPPHGQGATARPAASISARQAPVEMGDPDAQPALVRHYPWLDTPLGHRQGALSAEAIFQRHIAYDNGAWRPAYGVASAAVRDTLQRTAQSGLRLEGTFSAKSFHTLRTYGQADYLSGKRVLFWNTHHRFAIEALVNNNIRG